MDPTMNTARRVLLGLAIVATAGFLSAFCAGAIEGGSLNAQLEMVRACTGSCVMPCQGSASAHANVSGTTHGKGQHGCEVVALDCSYHSCSVTQASPLTLDVPRYVATRDIRGLAEIIPAEQLVYVPERGVLQVVADCGSVIAQLPVSAAEMRALE